MMEHKSILTVMFVFILIIFGGLVAWDLNHDSSKNKESKTNWNWDDDWKNLPITNQKNDLVKENPIKESPKESPKKEPELVKPQGQMVATSYSNAIEDAQKYDMKVVILFGADWCGHCKNMKSTTYPDAGVKKSLTNYIVLYVNTDEDKETTRKFGIKALPTQIILDKKEDILKSNLGFQNPSQFINWLN